MTLKSAFVGKVLKVDRPFIAYIHDGLTDTVLFITTLNNPTTAVSEIRSRGIPDTSAQGKGNNGAGQVSLTPLASLLPILTYFLFKAL